MYRQTFFLSFSYIIANLGLQPAIKRAKIFAPYADLLWVETSTPNLSSAQYFSGKIKEQYPDKWFVYNLSPSFNWAKFGFSGVYLVFRYCTEFCSNNSVFQMPT